ncbi:MAG: 5-formyltetrahydrofolate cyclo-ligase [Flavobacteriaceae bacterium]
MLKKEIRLNYIQIRKRLSPEEVNTSSEAICDFLRQLPLWDFEYYHVFLPIIDNNEVDTQPIIDQLRSQGKKIVVPKVKNSDSLEHILFEEDTSLKKNHWGIPEPEAGDEIPVRRIDLVFVPMLAFDQKGHRVGYGKGFYDRFLDSCRADTLKIGLCFFEAIGEISDVGPSDISIDYCITPQQVYEF